MELYPIELTSADVIAHEELFRREFIDLLGCQHLTVIPPFPDYQLLSRSRAPRPLLKAVNEVVLSRRPTYDQNGDWLLVPLALGNKVLGVLLAEGVAAEWRMSERVPVLEHLVHLCLEVLQWEKRAARDGETMLWQRQALVHEVLRALEAAETAGRMVSRRLLGQGDGPIHFTLVCMVTTPAPEPWAGAGPFWVQRGPLVEKSLPSGALAAHLGGGCVAVFWPGSAVNEVRIWLDALIHSMGGAGASPGSWTLHAGICAFPEDFYDVGPVLPWEKTGGQDRPTAAEEVVRRGILTAEAARDILKVTMLTYQTLRERGLAPKPEAAAERELTPLLVGEEPCALLLVRVDEWERWHRQHGAQGAARRAKEVLKTSRRLCPAGAALHWAGPDRFIVFLPGADRERAEKQAHAIRGRARSERGTTVSVGLSLFPCEGFSKGDLLENARKAVIHTGFFGPDTQTVFDAVSLNISGDRLFEAGHLEQALQEFHRALALDPGNVNVRNSLGVCYAQMGRIDEAAAEFSRVAALKADDFMPHYNLGCALVSLGRAREGEQALKRAAHLDPSDPAVWFRLATMCKEEKRAEEAVSHLRRTVELRPQWLHAWRLLGIWLLENGDEDEEAMAAFKRALRLNAADAAALSGLAVVYGQREMNREVALSLARRSVQIEPANALYLERFARLLFQSGEVEEALTHCRRAAELAPEDGRIRALLGEIGGAQRASTS